MKKEAQDGYKQEQQEVPLVLMRIPQILKIMPISRATFCNMVKNGEFPKPTRSVDHPYGPKSRCRRICGRRSKRQGIDI
jgi:hypothetical protein